MTKYDLVIKNCDIADAKGHLKMIHDIGIKDGKIVKITQHIDIQDAYQVLDVENHLVIPGLIDSHVHIVRPNSKLAGYRMLVKAGVTTAIDFRGPVDDVIEKIDGSGFGLNVGVLNGISPGNGIKSLDASYSEIEEFIDHSIGKGALGVKILGGHFPVTPDTAQKVIEVANNRQVYVAYHAGSTENGSNINGMIEAIESANGNSLHLAHINSYCRGLVEDPILEVKTALDILSKSPNIFSESYLSQINGTSADMDEDHLPKSHVTRNCLIMNGYEENFQGMSSALKDGICGLYTNEGEEMLMLYGEEAYNKWVENGYRANICFPVNPVSSTINCAIAKNKENRFIIDAISTDGGAIPRNSILDKGLALVDYEAMTLEEFAFKTSYSPARIFGLFNKGLISEGYDADITVVERSGRRPKATIIGGDIVMMDGYLLDKPACLIVTEKAVSNLKDRNIRYEVADLTNSAFYKGRSIIY